MSHENNVKVYSKKKAGFEINSQVSSFFKLIYIYRISYSTCKVRNSFASPIVNSAKNTPKTQNVPPQLINPWWVTGFTEGKGCFSITITRNNEMKIGFRVKLIFAIGLHERDKVLLEQIKNFFKVGSINWTKELIQFNFKYNQ